MRRSDRGPRYPGIHRHMSVLWGLWGAVRTQVVNEVPQPQLDLALGFTKVKPPVSPWFT